MNPQKILVALALSLYAGGALAHAGHGESHGLLAGIAHPATGWDHALIALVAGLAAAQWQARAWRLPVLFLGGMAAGIVAGLALPFGAWVEHGVVLSLLATGALLLAPLQQAARALTATAALVIGACGAAHGVVHGVEAGFAPSYLGGVLLGTALLHASGIALGRAGWMSARMLQAVGAGTAAVGGLLLLP